MTRKRPKPRVDWSSAPQSARKRKKVQVTLSDEARARLAKLGAKHPHGQSGVIEDLLTGMTEKS